MAEQRASKERKELFFSLLCCLKCWLKMLCLKKKSFLLSPPPLFLPSNENKMRWNNNWTKLKENARLVLWLQNVREKYVFFFIKNNTIFIHFNSFFNHRNTEMDEEYKKKRQRERKIVDWIKSIYNPFQSYFTKSFVNEIVEQRSQFRNRIFKELR